MFSLTALYFVFLTVTPLTALLFPLYSTARSRNKVACALGGPDPAPPNPPGKTPQLCPYTPGLAVGKGVSSPKDPQTNKTLLRLPEPHQHSELPLPHRAGHFKECKSTSYVWNKAVKGNKTGGGRKGLLQVKGFVWKFAS